MVTPTSGAWLVVRRGTAYVTDIVILFSGVLAAQFTLKAVTGFPSQETLDTGLRIELWVLVSVSLPTWLYFALLESSRWRGTLGKRLLRITVADRTGARIAPGRAAARTLVKVIPWEVTHLSLMLPTPLLAAESPELRPGLIVANALLVIYVVALLATKGERTIHDFVAGTEIRPAETPDGRVAE